MNVYTVTVTNADWDVPEVFIFDTEDAATEAAESIRQVIKQIAVDGLGDPDEYDVSEIVGLPVLSADRIPAIVADVKEWWG